MVPPLAIIFGDCPLSITIKRGFALPWAEKKQLYPHWVWGQQGIKETESLESEFSTQERPPVKSLGRLTALPSCLLLCVLGCMLKYISPLCGGGVQPG